MVTLLELAADEALLQGRDFGLEINQYGYRFVEYDPYSETWLEIADDDMLRERTVPEDLRFELYIEDRRVLLNDQPAALQIDDDDSDDERTSNYAPHALIMSSGQLSPFEVELIRDRDRMVQSIIVHPDGRVELQDRDDADR